MPWPRLSPFAALRHRNFRIFYTGQTISLTGTWMQHLALGWLVLELTDSAFWVGLVAFLGALPVLLFSLPAGVYVDRADKHRVVAVCQGLLLSVAGTLTVLTATGVVRPWHLALLAAFAGSVNAMEIPARQALIVELVGREDLTNAIALNSSAFNATRIVGPSIAGVLVARVSIAACFALNALSFLAMLVALARVRLARAAPMNGGGDAMHRFLEGLSFARADRRVLALILNTAVLSLLGFPFVVLMPVFARDVLAVGAEGLGVMSACVGIGAVASAFGLASAGPGVRRGRLVAWAGPAFGVGVVGFAYAPTFPLALAALMAAGFAMVLNNAATNALLQGIVPDALRGRVMSLWTFVFVGLAPLGSLHVGWLAGRIGAPAAVAIGGAVAAVATVLVLRRVAPDVSGLR